VILCEASHEQSVKFHEAITQNAEDLIAGLGLPYHVVINCGGDLGLGQVKKYDIECWNPAEGKYRETHSASYFHDFQTRRLNIKYRDENGKSRYAHSLNNTALATPRILISIIENYQQAFFGGKRTGLVISSRGCPYHCTFCLWPETLYGHKHRQRNPKNVINEIEHLVKNYGVDEIYFDDDTFIIKKQLIIVFYNELMNRKLNLPWLCMGRVNTVDYEILKLMKN